MFATPVWLGWRSVRHRPGIVLGATIVLTIAATLVSAFAFIYYSADQQVATVERYAAAPVVVASDYPFGGVPMEVTERIGQLPEAAETVPEVNFPASVLTPDGDALQVPGTQNSFGHGWGSAPLTPFDTVEGEPPRTDTDVVVDQEVAATGGIRVGDRVRVLVLGTIAEYEVSGIAAPAQGVSWDYQSALFVEDGHAWDLWELAPDRASAIGVLPADGVSASVAQDAVAAVLGDTGGGEYRALAGAERGEAEQNISAQADQAAASSIFMLLVWTAVVSTGVVAGAIGLAVRGRGREIAVLRAVGAAPRQVRLMVAGEALVLSLAALVMGLPLGLLIAEALATGGLTLGGGFSPAYSVHFTPAAVLATVLFVLLSAQVSGAIAARYALRIRPSEALAESTTEGRELGRGRVVAGLVALAGSLAGAFALAFLALEGTRGDLANTATVLLGVAGAGLLAPWLLRGTTRLMRRLRGGRPKGPGLALANVSFYHRRFASVAGSLLLGLTLVGAAGAAQLYNNWLAGDRGAEAFSSDFMVVTTGDDGFGDGSLAAAADIPGVAAATSQADLPVEVDTAAQVPEQVMATVVTDDADATVDLAVAEGGFAPQEAGAAMVSTYFAQANDLSVGDTMTLHGPDPELAQEMRVSGVYGEGFLGRQVTLGPAAAESIGIGPVWSADLHLSVEEGADTVAVRDRLEEAFPAQSATGLFHIHDRDGIRDHSMQMWAEQNTFGSNAVILIAVFLALGAANSISVAQFDRTREFSSMRLLGISGPQTYRTVGSEVVLTVGVLLGMAALVTVWIAALLGLGYSGSTLTVLPHLLPYGPVLALGALALVLSTSGALGAVRSARAK
ncbi:FtsX-like permease family protein [Nocardiopsis nanhaiensis]